MGKINDTKAHIKAILYLKKNLLNKLFFNNFNISICHDVQVAYLKFFDLFTPSRLKMQTITFRMIAPYINHAFYDS